MLLPIYRSAVRQFDVRVRAVRPDQWSSPTQADGWDVADVVRHVVDGQRSIPPTVDDAVVKLAAASTSTASTSTASTWTASTLVGDWADASTEALDALAAVESWGMVVTSPWPDTSMRSHTPGELSPSTTGETAEEFGWRMATELTVHSFDVARAIGTDQELPNDLLAYVLREVTAHAADWLTPDRYAPAIPVPGCADDLTELLALTDRNRWWRPL